MTPNERKQYIHKAVASLNHKDDSHWNKNGEPSVKKVAAKVRGKGVPKVTEGEVNATGIRRHQPIPPFAPDGVPPTDDVPSVSQTQIPPKAQPQTKAAGYKYTCACGACKHNNPDSCPCCGRAQPKASSTA